MVNAHLDHLQSLQQTTFSPSILSFTAAWFDIKYLCIQNVSLPNLIDTHDVLLAVEAIMSIFIRINFVGPFHLTKDINFIDNQLFSSLFPEAHCDSSHTFDIVNRLNVACANELSIDGELFSSLVLQPFLLKLAIDLINSNNSNVSDIQHWKIRLSFMHQYYLDNPAISLKNCIMSSLYCLDEDQSFASNPIYLIERANIDLYYSGGAADGNKIKEQLVKIDTLLGIQWSFVGALGKRTKFQQHEVVQLSLKISARKMELQQSFTAPENVLLNHETLLEHMTPTTDTEHSVLLSAIQQTAFLLHCRFLIESQPYDVLLCEQLEALIQGAILGQKSSNWTVFSLALWIRSFLEMSNPKKLERGIMQSQALFHQIASSLPGEDISQRLEYFWCHLSGRPMFKSCGILDRFQMERGLGKIYMKYGAFATAMETFQKLGDWENYIICLAMTEKRDYAIGVLKKLLEEPLPGTNPKLWHLLGELLDDPTYYEKAFEVSRGTFMKSRRSMGLYFMKREQWKEAIAFFEESLAINPLFESIWFALGCCYLKLPALDEKYEKALQAFGRVVSIDSSHKESWSNIAMIHLIREDYGAAKVALKEALKQSFDYEGSAEEDWRKWDNYLTCCFKLKDLPDAIMAFSKILSLQKDRLKELMDWRTLNGLYSVLREQVLSGSLKQDTFLVKRFYEILCVLEGTFSDFYGLWELKANFLALFPEDTEVILAAYLKAYRAISSNLDAFSTSSDLIDDFCRIVDKIESLYATSGIPDVSFRMSLRNLAQRRQKELGSRDFLVTKLLAKK
jgi:tetratricopeptide (TPR) repeat protein